jgi:hypothetical protein
LLQPLLLQALLLQALLLLHSLLLQGLLLHLSGPSPDNLLQLVRPVASGGSQDLLLLNCQWKKTALHCTALRQVTFKA